MFTGYIIQINSNNIKMSGNMPQENRLTRETVTVLENTVERIVPSSEFEALLDSSESVADVNVYILKQRMTDAWEPYTTLAEATGMPQIEVLPFELERIDPGNIRVVAPFVSGDVVSLKNVLYGADGDNSQERLEPYFEQVYFLKHRLFQSTAGIIEAPGSAMWYEAFLSQFIYIPPNATASVGGVDKQGGPQGTFLMVDLDPRFTTVSHDANAEIFRERLDFQLLLLTGEGDTLCRMSTLSVDSDPTINLVDSIVPLSRFRDQCPLSSELLHLVLGDVVESPRSSLATR